MIPASLADNIQSFADALFMPWVVGLLLGAGLFMTLRLRVVQLRRFADACRVTFVRRGTGTTGALTPFQAFMTALAASIGTGNIAGVATAIVSGGPGALFWIWVYGFVAMAIKFGEAVLGVTFRETRAGTVLSGPMYYLRDGLRSPFLAWLFALVAAIAALTTTPFTQPNSMALVLNTVVGIPKLVSGIVIAVLTWLVIIGGIKSIGRAAEKLSPLKVALYLTGGVIVIVVNRSRMSSVFEMIFDGAFSMNAVAGGSLGMFVAMRYGIARGIYANEAGYGTAAVAYGTAQSAQPVQQGLNAVMEVFIVSFVTSTISAMTILLTGVWQSGTTSSAAVAAAFNSAMPGIGGYVVAFCVFLFGYTTLIGWAYYGEQFFEYILGLKVTTPYRWIYCLLIPFGAMGPVNLVWAWGDLMNALQVFPNLIGVVGLSGIVAKAANERLRTEPLLDALRPDPVPMARIAFTTWGSLGDLHPYLALALELKGRGHHAIVATLPTARGHVERAGIEFRPLRPDVPTEDPNSREVVRKILDVRTGPEFLFKQVLAPHMRATYDDTLAAVKDAELLVSHQLPITAPIVVEQTGIPWVSGVVAPMGFLSGYDPPTLPHAPWLRQVGLWHPAIGGAIRQLSRAVTKRWLESWYQLRKDLGMPPNGHPLFEGQHSPSCVLALFSRAACSEAAGLSGADGDHRVPVLRRVAAAPARSRAPAFSRRRRAADCLHARLGRRVGRGRFLSRQHRGRACPGPPRVVARRRER